MGWLSKSRQPDQSRFVKISPNQKLITTRNGCGSIPSYPWLFTCPKQPSGCLCGDVHRTIYCLADKLFTFRIYILPGTQLLTQLRYLHPRVRLGAGLQKWLCPMVDPQVSIVVSMWTVAINYWMVSRYDHGYTQIWTEKSQGPSFRVRKTPVLRQTQCPTETWRAAIGHLKSSPRRAGRRARACLVSKVRPREPWWEASPRKTCESIVVIDHWLTYNYWLTIH